MCSGLTRKKPSLNWVVVLSVQQKEAIGRGITGKLLIKTYSLLPRHFKEFQGRGEGRKGTRRLGVGGKLCGLGGPWGRMEHGKAPSAKLGWVVPQNPSFQPLLLVLLPLAPVVARNDPTSWLDVTPPLWGGRVWLLLLYPTRHKY